MPQLRVKSHTHQGAEALGVHRGQKRNFLEPHAFHPPARRAHRSEGPGASRQPQSNKWYGTTLPADMTPVSCSDVGYQSDTQAKPYSQNLRDLLIQDRKCLACRQTDHGISTCPAITPEIAQGMHTFHARRAPISALSMSVHPKQHATGSRRANQGMQECRIW